MGFGRIRGALYRKELTSEKCHFCYDFFRRKILEKCIFKALCFCVQEIIEFSREYVPVEVIHFEIALTEKRSPVLAYVASRADAEFYDSLLKHEHGIKQLMTLIRVHLLRLLHMALRNGQEMIRHQLGIALHDVNPCSSPQYSLPLLINVAKWA